MILWLDAQLSPALADWIRSAFGVDCAAVRDHGLQNADDHTIFMAARAAGAVSVSLARALAAWCAAPQTDPGFADDLAKIGEADAAFGEAHPDKRRGTVTPGQLKLPTVTSN